MGTSGRSLQQLVEEYASSPVSAGRAMGELLAHRPRRFYNEALQVLKAGTRTPGHAHLVNLLIDNDLLPEALASPSHFTLEEAVEFFGALIHIEPQMDIKLARWMLRLLSNEPLERAASSAHRILAILERSNATQRLGPLLIQLMRLPNPSLRSKAVLLLGRGPQDVRWALADQDARVRANAVEALWGADSTEARRALWVLARDPHNRVVGNALLALLKLGEPDAAEALVTMAGHDSPKFRATAAWVMGQTRDDAFLETLQQLERDPDDNVRGNARLALARLAPAADAAQSAA